MGAEGEHLILTAKARVALHPNPEPKTQMLHKPSRLRALADRSSCRLQKTRRRHVERNLDEVRSVAEMVPVLEEKPLSFMGWQPHDNLGGYPVRSDGFTPKPLRAAAPLAQQLI